MGIAEAYSIGIAPAFSGILRLMPMYQQSLLYLDVIKQLEEKVR